MHNNNREIARIFREMSTIYEFLGEDQQFRARAYDKGARVVANLMQSVEELEDEEALEEINGIGESMAEKIEEYIEKGKISKHEELKKEIPEDFIDLLQVSGFGPETLKTLYEELGVKTKNQIKKGLESGDVEELKGFGEKKVENMLKGLKKEKKSEERILLWEAQEIAESLEKIIGDFDGVKKIAVAGSIRRRKETIGDVDILVAVEEGKAEDVLKAFTEMDSVIDVLAEGDTKSSVVIEDRNRQVDLRLVEEEVWGAALFYFTGSKEHNVHLRKMAKEEGYKISEYGLFNTDTDKKITAKTEKGIYRKMNMAYVPPEMREDRGEIEAAEKDEIPDLIQLDDIRGDLHMHSNWSDGNHSIRELAEHIRENYDYDYIALTDHSKSLPVAGGLDEEKVREQIEAIEKVNDDLGEEFIKCGIEVDIMSDGSLDLSDDVLSELDWVVAAIHSKMNQDNTKRLIKACENQYVCALAHPTGRMLNSRDPYDLDMDAVLDAAKETQTALEINGQPKRSDLNDRWARAAKEKDIPLVISTDSHYFGNLEFMKNGVYIARRAWCTKDDLLNTRKWEDIEKFIEKKRGAKSA